jgi:hypothetical protein
MEFSVAGVANQRKKFPQTAKVGIVLLITALLVTRNVPQTAIIVVVHWFSHNYLFPT